MFDANFYDTETDEEYWLSGPHRDGADTRYSAVRQTSTKTFAWPTRPSSRAAHHPAESMGERPTLPRGAQALREQLPVELGETVDAHSLFLLELQGVAGKAGGPHIGHLARGAVVQLDRQSRGRWLVW